MRDRRRVAAIAGAGLEGELLGRGGCAEGKRLQPFLWEALVSGSEWWWALAREASSYVAVLCESLRASYGDIAVIVPATLLRLLLAPLLERHGVTRSGGGCDMLATMLVNGCVPQKRVSTFVGSVVDNKSCTGDTRGRSRGAVRRGDLYVQFGMAGATQGGARKAEVCSRHSAVAIESAGSDVGARQLGSLGSRDSTAQERGWLVVGSEVGTVVEAGMQREQ